MTRRKIMNEALNQIQEAMTTVQRRLPNVAEPPKFAGTVIEDPKEFLAWYEHVAELNRWTETEKIKFLGLSLIGEAKKWYGF